MRRERKKKLTAAALYEIPEDLLEGKLEHPVEPPSPVPTPTPSPTPTPNPDPKTPPEPHEPKPDTPEPSPGPIRVPQPDTPPPGPGEPAAPLPTTSPIPPSVPTRQLIFWALLNDGTREQWLLPSFGYACASLKVNEALFELANKGSGPRLSPRSGGY